MYDYGQSQRGVGLRVGGGPGLGGREWWGENGDNKYWNWNNNFLKISK